MGASIGLVKPDIIVVLEVRSGPGPLGSLASAGGAAASVTLLTWLREGGEQWCLVPPLRLVDYELDQKPYTEAICMYYRADHLDFVGPMGWPQNRPESGFKVPVPPTDPLGPYAEPFNNALPQGNHFAGLPWFYTDGQEVLFPGKSNRRPFLCQFRERAGAQRLITVAASHPSPGVLPSVAGNRLFGWLTKPGNNEVQVFPGDFNVDQLKSPSFYYQAELIYGVQSNFAPQAGPTKVIKIDNATPAAYLAHDSIDNILTRYGPGTQPPNPNHAYILNFVSGVPNVFQSLMEVALNNYGQYGFFANDNFRLPKNYGKIAHEKGVSDHMALTLDI